MALGMQNLNSLMALAVAMFVILSRDAEALEHKKDKSIFCSLSEDPEFCDILVQGANTSVEATGKAIKESILIARILEPYVHKSMETLEMPPDPKKTVTTTCNVDFRKVTDNYAKALNHLSKGNKKGIAAHLSKKTLTNCVSNLNKYNVHAPVVRKAKADLDKYMKTCALVAKNV